MPFNMSLMKLVLKVFILIGTRINIVRAKMPLLHFCSDSKEAVPFEVNTAKLETNFKTVRGVIHIILKHTPN